jgi:hypothetical protein
MFNDECKNAKYKIGQYVRVVKGNKENIDKVGRIQEVYQLERYNGMVENDTCKGYVRATYAVTGVNDLLYSYQIELLVPQPKEIDILTENFPVQIKGTNHVKITLNRPVGFDKLIAQLKAAKEEFVSSRKKAFEDKHQLKLF